MHKHTCTSCPYIEAKNTVLDNVLIICADWILIFVYKVRARIFIYKLFDVNCNWAEFEYYIWFGFNWIGDSVDIIYVRTVCVRIRDHFLCADMLWIWSLHSAYRIIWVYLNFEHLICKRCTNSIYVNFNSIRSVL